MAATSLIREPRCVIYPSTPVQPGTNLTCARLTHMRHARGALGMVAPTDRAERAKACRCESIGVTSNVYEPIVFIPDGGNKGFVSVPSGFVALHSIFSNNQEKPLEPGLRFLGPGHRIDFLVTKHAFVFDTPVSNVITADNVKVMIDCQILLEIINPNCFVFSLNADKFDQVLRDAQEDAIRALARTIKISEARDLQGMDTQDVLSQLSAQTQTNGVRILNINITSVRLHPSLAQTLELAAATQTSKSLEVRVQEYEMVRLNNDKNLQLARTRIDNAVLEAKQEADRRVSELAREVRETEARADKAVAAVNAERNAEIAEITARASVEVAKLEAEMIEAVAQIRAEGEKEVADLNARAAAFRLRCDATVESIIKQAEAERTLLVGAAEAEFAQAMAAKRRFDIEMQRPELVKALAANQKAVVTSGVDFMIDTGKGGSLMGRGAPPQVYLSGQSK